MAASRNVHVAPFERQRWQGPAQGALVGFDLASGTRSHPQMVVPHDRFSYGNSVLDNHACGWTGPDR
jgi:hypothetical protein